MKTLNRKRHQNHKKGKMHTKGSSLIWKKEDNFLFSSRRWTYGKAELADRLSVRLRSPLRTSWASQRLDYFSFPRLWELVDIFLNFVFIGFLVSPRCAVVILRALEGSPNPFEVTRTVQIVYVVPGCSFDILTSDWLSFTMTERVMLSAAL